jgi:hypothetical protein
LFASDREFFGNGVQSYIEAYGVIASKPSSYAAARANSSRLLTKANILQRITTLLEDTTLNDQFVDKQLAFLIVQNADMSTKMRAITEYNKLRQRVTDKIDLAVSEKPKPLFDRSNNNDRTNDGTSEDPISPKKD